MDLIARPGGSSPSRRSPWAGPSCRPTSQVQSWSMAVSYRPTSVPSGPLIRCSSSWMIRSGGRSGVGGDRAGGAELAVLALGVAAGVVDLGRAEAVALAEPVDLAEEHLDLALPRHLGELVHRGDQQATAAGGRSPRRPPRPAGPRPAACRRLKRHWPNLSPQ